MKGLKKEFWDMKYENPEVIWGWIEEKLKESYHKGETRGHHLGYQQAEKSIPSFKDAIEVLKYHLEDNYETE